ncbi:MAG: methyl-accepting chemotaxis protein [Geminicoccaceae bacterium]
MFAGIFGKHGLEQNANAQGKLQAIDRALAVIEFDLDGNVQSANENFLSVMGYRLEEIVGQHHRLFVDPTEASSPSYANFWRELKNGQFKSSQYKRLAKGGKEIWIQASYNPVLDTSGKPVGVIKFATDITAQKLAEADASGKVAAISRSQAMIEFNLDGEILDANDNFLNAMGYSLNEIRGRHHRMFVEPTYASSQDYREFWAALGRGEFRAAEYKRLAKGGKEIWIQASYNPILNAEGKPIKVVKFATDITERKNAIKITKSSLEQLSEGDLRTSITTEFPGDLNDLREAFNLTVEKLRALVHEIGTSASEVESAASEIASGTSDLASRTEQAASNIEETAASTEEMSATVKQNAESARNANQLADAANQTASEGGKVVEQAVVAMSGIESSAQKITDIISVIDEIAFQTNLLALNASVEAARAGEAGKGFAVVAQEVRQLAQRSAQAASDIKILIQGSNSQVKDGVQLVNKAGEALGQIVGSIGEVASIVRDIANASQEQAAGVHEINTAVNSMDEMTQQNSALVEESTAAARALSDQASKLTEHMAFFKHDNAHAPARSRQTSPSPSTPKRPAPIASPAVAATNDGWSEF